MGDATLHLEVMLVPWGPVDIYVSCIHPESPDNQREMWLSRLARMVQHPCVMHLKKHASWPFGPAMTL